MKRLLLRWRQSQGLRRRIAEQWCSRIHTSLYGDIEAGFYFTYRRWCDGQIEIISEGRARPGEIIPMSRWMTPRAMRDAIIINPIRDKTSERLYGVAPK